MNITKFLRTLVLKGTAASVISCFSSLNMIEQELLMPESNKTLSAHKNNLQLAILIFVSDLKLHLKVYFLLFPLILY